MVNFTVVSKFPSSHCISKVVSDLVHTQKMYCFNYTSTFKEYNPPHMNASGINVLIPV